MATENKYRWMIWVIVVLAVMNLTTLITILVQPGDIPDETIPALSEQAGSENESVRYSGRYFRDQLNLTGDQMNRFSEFNPVFRNKVRNLNHELAKIKQQMMHEMAAEKIDTLKLNMLSDSIGHMHAGLKKLTYRYYMDFKEICDSDQQKKLEQMFGEMFATDNQPGQYMQRGRNGRGYGKGFGRRFNN